MRALSSRMVRGMSPPNTATELAKTRRGAVRSRRQASRSACVPSKFTRMPRSKSASAAPLTTAARWKTNPVSSSIRSARTPGSAMSPATTASRGSSGIAGSGGMASKAITCSIGSASPEGPVTLARASRADTMRRPMNPVPPVTTIFIIPSPISAACLRRSRSGIPYRKSKEGSIMVALFEPVRRA